MQTLAPGHSEVSSLVVRRPSSGQGTFWMPSVPSVQADCDLQAFKLPMAGRQGLPTCHAMPFCGGGKMWKPPVGFRGCRPAPPPDLQQLSPKGSRPGMKCQTPPDVWCHAGHSTSSATTLSFTGWDQSLAFSEGSPQTEDGHRIC